MNDNEIIKAFEQHIERTKNIKYGARKKTLVDAELLKDILDLINHQQAEIERLRKENNQFADIGKLYSEIKSEAIKEFVHEILSPFKDKVYLSKRDLEIIVNNLAKYYEQPCKRNGG